MPSLDEWWTALSAEREVLVTSSQALVQAIRDKQDARVDAFQAKQKQPPPFKQNLTAVAEFNPNKTIIIRPIDLLHAIGVTLTPPVPNLVDLSSTWAIWRYIWAFSYPRRHREKLRLSETARKIDFHQKAVLSDEIGVGMASYLMANYLDAPEPIDISVAVGDEQSGLRKQFSTSPDYLFTNNTRTVRYIVECKGSQTGRSNVLDQLRRGTEQLPSIVSVTGAPLPSLVFGTHLTRRKVEVLVIDPPESDESEQSVEKTGDRSWRVKDEPEFSARLGRIHSSKILAYAGDPSAGIEKLPLKISKERRRFIRGRRPNARIETELGDFVGVTSPLPIEDDAKVQVFQGVDAGLRATYASPDPEQVLEGVRRFVGTFAARNRAPGYFSVDEQTDQGITIRSYSVQGTVLEFRISR